MLVTNQLIPKLNAEAIKIFSEEEKGVIIEPILIVIVIPNKYGAGSIFKIRQARIVKGTKIIATVISAIIAAVMVPIVQMR